MFLSDESISYPFVPSTISSGFLLLTSFFVPLIFIIFVEISIGFRDGQKVQFNLRQSTFHVPNYLVSIARMSIGYLLGAAISQCLTDIAVMTIGRLRPNFLEVCNPNVDCKSPENFHKYITNYTCLGNENLFPDPVEREASIREARLSFFSGHASFSAQAMIFTMIYLQVKTNNDTSNFKDLILN